MPLKIVGSGYRRTGTMSTRIAPELLGFAACHRMVEVAGNRPPPDPATRSRR